jgi:acetyl-CoA acetyltransferase
LSVSRIWLAAKSIIATRMVNMDEGARADTSLEALAKLRPVFSPKGIRHCRQQLADIGRCRRTDSSSAKKSSGNST